MAKEQAEKFRVVYGESMPAWEQTFPTKKEADAFAEKHKSFGDVIFSIAPVVDGEKPQSLTAAIEAGEDLNVFARRMRKLYAQAEAR